MAVGAIIGVIGSVVGGALNVGKGAQEKKQQSEQHIFDITQQSIKERIDKEKRNKNIVMIVSIAIILVTLFVVYLIINKK